MLPITTPAFSYDIKSKLQWLNEARKNKQNTINHGNIKFFLNTDFKNSVRSGSLLSVT